MDDGVFTNVVLSRVLKKSDTVEWTSTLTRTYCWRTRADRDKQVPKTTDGFSWVLETRWCDRSQSNVLTENPNNGLYVRSLLGRNHVSRGDFKGFSVVRGHGVPLDKDLFLRLSGTSPASFQDPLDSNTRVCSPSSIRVRRRTVLDVVITGEG